MGVVQCAALYLHQTDFQETKAGRYLVRDAIVVCVFCTRFPRQALVAFAKQSLFAMRLASVWHLDVRVKFVEVIDIDGFFA
jgi:hypothetical protein